MTFESNLNNSDETKYNTFSNYLNNPTENKETLDNKKSGEDSDYDDNDNEELDDIDQYFADYYN